MQESLIRNKERAAQLIDFAGLRYGTGYPTDIDGMMEWKDKCYIFYEGKHVLSNGMNKGQRMALERVCDDLRKIKPTLVIVFTHNIEPPEVIDIASCKVNKCRWAGKWVDVKADVTVKKVTDWFLRKYGQYEKISSIP